MKLQKINENKRVTFISDEPLVTQLSPSPQRTWNEKNYNLLNKKWLKKNLVVSACPSLLRLQRYL